MFKVGDLVQVRLDNFSFLSEAILDSYDIIITLDTTFKVRHSFDGGESISISLNEISLGIWSTKRFKFAASTLTKEEKLNKKIAQLWDRQPYVTNHV